MFYHINLYFPPRHLIRRLTLGNAAGIFKDNLVPFGANAAGICPKRPSTSCPPSPQGEGIVLPAWGGLLMLLLFWKIFILNIFFDIFFHFNSLFCFQRPKILFVEDSFFTLFLCFCSKKRSFGNEMRNEIFLEKRSRKQLFFWDNTRKNCCVTAFFL